MNYQVVVNDEGQHSLWPSGREVPVGWRATGFEGAEQECVRHVDEVWTDIRPLSVRSTAEEARLP